MINIARPAATMLARALVLPAVLGATFLGGTAFAQAPTTPPAAMSPGDVKAETVEQRIASLHERLRITANQEADWMPVAQTMRDNADAMQKLVAAKKAQSSANMTALEDMMNYQAFAQAHVDGLKRLNSTFKTLYEAMPADQKAIADETFRSFGRTPVKQG